MTTPLTVLEGIVEAMQDSTAFSAGSYITHEPDFDGADNRLTQPIVSLEITDNPRAVEWDSDLAGFVLDNSGNPTGRRFEATWEMDIDAVITIAAGRDDLDVQSLGPEMQTALLPYDGQQEGQALPDPDSTGTLGDVDHFSVGDGTPQPDLAGPGLRVWRQELEATFVAVRTTDDPQITTVTVPQSKEFQPEESGEQTLVWKVSYDTS